MPHETLLCHFCSSSCFGQCRWVRFSKLHCDCCVGLFIHPLNFEWKMMGWFPSSHCQDQNMESTLLRQKGGVNDLSWHHAVLTVALTWESLAMTHRASTISNCFLSHHKKGKRGVGRVLMECFSVRTLNCFHRIKKATSKWGCVLMECLAVRGL